MLVCIEMCLTETAQNLGTKQKIMAAGQSFRVYLVTVVTV